MQDAPITHDHAKREHARWLTENDADDSFSAPVSTSRRDTERDARSDTRR